MLVEVGAEADVLQGEEIGSPQWARAVHQAAVRALAGHGRLVFATTDARERFLDALERLPHGVRDLWRTALEESQIECVVALVHGLPSFSEMTGRAEIKAAWSAAADVLLLDEYSREILAYEQGELPDDSGSPEVTDLTCLATSSRLEAARTAFVRPLLKGEQRPEFWKQRFATVMRHTQRLSLYDKFAGEQMVRHGETKAKRDGGVQWLADRAAAAGVARFVIYTGWITGADRQIPKEAIVEAAHRIGMDAGGVMKVDVFSCWRSEVGHDRHMLFDHRAAVALGRGIELLAEEIVSETSMLGVVDAATARKRERALEVRARRESA